MTLAASRNRPTTGSMTSGKGVTGKNKPKAAAAADGSGQLAWWQYRSVQRSLAAFGAGLQGKHRVPMTFKRTGLTYTDFSKPIVVVDPEVASDPDPALHLIKTKGLICHEEGHVVFTTPFMGLDTTRTDMKQQLLARVINILEDERIERAMMARHWGTEKYLRYFKRSLWESAEMPELNPAEENPYEVLSAILQVRFGWQMKGSLHPKNKALFDECWPFVVRAWNGIDTAVVKACAEEIIRILNLEEVTQEMIDKMPKRNCVVSLRGRRGDKADAGPGGKGMPGGGKGEEDGEGGGTAGASSGRGKGDKEGQGGGKGDQEGEGDGEEDGEGAGGKQDGEEEIDGQGGKDGKDADTEGEGDEDGDKGDQSDDPGDDEIVLVLDDEELASLLEEADEELAKLFGRQEGSKERDNSVLGARAVPSDAWDKAKERAQVLARLLRRIPPKPRSQAVESGGRYSYRDEARNPDRSFRKRDIPTRQRTAAIGILVDCSGSMHQVMPHVVAAVLALYQAAREVDVPVAVWAFSSWSPPTQTVVRFGDNPQIAPERIAGLHATGGTLLADALLEASEALLDQRADRRVLLVVHDGAPADMAESVENIQKIRRKVEPVGIFIGEEATEGMYIEPMKQLFGDRLIVAPEADALMVLLGTFLARLLQPQGV